MFDLNIPQKTIDVLFKTVKDRLGNRTLGDFPFYTRVDRDTMEKSLGSFVDVNKISAGYIYGHDETIPLHTDKWKSTSYFNLNIPLFNETEEQYFMIFDQEFPDRGCEWQVGDVSQKRHEPLTPEDKKSSENDNDHLESICYSGIRPCETSVMHLTNKPVNSEMLPHLPFEESFYFGLSGKVWKQEVGKGLVFRTTQLHGTAKQQKFKVGSVFLLETDQAILH